MYSTLRLIAPAVALALLATASFAEEAAPAAAAPAAAATATAPKSTIAVLNVELLMRESLAAKSMNEQLEKKFKAFREQVSAKQTEIQKEEQELAKQRSVMAQDAFDKKQKEFREKATTAQREFRTTAEQLDKAEQRAVGDIYKATTEILAQIAKEKGYLLVLPSSRIPYKDESLDITDEVMKKLNAKLPKVTVNFSGK